MTSKEALENVNNYLILNCHSCKNDDCKDRLDTKLDCSEWCEVIKQDIERLEELEKVIEILKRRNVCVYLLTPEEYKILKEYL